MKNQIKTIVLLGALSALLVGIGGALGPHYLWVFAALALGMNLFAYFFSDRLVLRMYGARELSPAEAPALHAMVEDLAAAIAIPKPRVHHAASAITFAGLFGRSDESDESAGGGLAFALVAPITASLVQLGISRSREYLADETGARLTGGSVNLKSQ